MYNKRTRFSARCSFDSDVEVLDCDTSVLTAMKNGTLKDVTGSGEMVFSADGEPVRVFGVSYLDTPFNPVEVHAARRAEKERAAAAASAASQVVNQQAQANVTAAAAKTE